MEVAPDAPSPLPPEAFFFGIVAGGADAIYKVMKSMAQLMRIAASIVTLPFSYRVPLYSAPDASTAHSRCSAAVGLHAAVKALPEQRKEI